ncbi:MAG: hypothetical protein KDC24_05235 [Saprospiraceae bacterium]|nr:hypothetical protein [Saprospiraceae bacterium]
MFDFKVEYLPTSQYKKKWYIQNVDGLKLAKETEALLLEYHNNGYDLFKMETIISSNPANQTSSQTDGILLVFRKRNEE